MSHAVLIVENDLREWELIRDVLLLRGDEPTWAKSEIDALRLFGTKSFDLILIEALLPKMGGYELCRKLKYSSRGKKTPILLMGSVLRNLRLAQQACHHYGADDILVKPFKSEDLKKKLERYLVPEEEDLVDDQEQPIELDELNDLPFVRALTETIPIEGDLEQIPAIYLLPYFASVGPGVLRIVSGKAETLVYFQGQKPVYVSSNLREQSLGRILVKSGVIDELVYRASLAKMAETNRRQGEVLIEMGAITSHQLFEAILHQAEAKLVDLCGWTKGSYSYRVEDFNCGDECLVAVDLIGVLRQALARLTDDDPAGRLFQRLSSLPVWRVKKPLIRLNGLGSVERRLLNAVDGVKSIGELAEGVDLEPAQVRLLILILLATGNLVTMAQELEESGAVERARIREALGDREPIKSEQIKNRFTTFSSPNLKMELGLAGLTDKTAIKEKIDQAAGPIMALDLAALDPLDRIRAQYVLRRAEQAFEQLTGSPADQSLTLQTSIGDRSRREQLKSELAFQKGLDLLSDDEFDEAINSIKSAHRLSPDVAEYAAYLGWAIYNSSAAAPEIRLDQANALLEEAQAANYNQPDSFLVRGRIALDQGQTQSAAASFEEVLVRDPENIEALSRLREIDLSQDDRLDRKDETSYSSEVEIYKSSLDKLQKNLFTQTHYQILDIDPEAAYDDIKRSFFHWTGKIQDMEVLRRVSPAVHEQADLILLRIEGAYQALTDQDRHRHYDEFLQLLKGRVRNLKNGQGTQAEKEFQGGLDAMAKGDLRLARSFFKRAAATYPLDPRYHAFTGIVNYQLGKAGAESGVSAAIGIADDIGRALMLDADCEEANLFVAEILTAKGLKRAAVQYLEKALVVNPANLEALKLRYRCVSSYRPRITAVAKEDLLDQGSSLDEALMSFVYKIEVLHDKIQHMNYFEILEIGLYASEEDIEYAFEQVRKRLSFSDIYNDLDAGVRRKVDAIQAKIRESHDTLIDDNLSAIYRRRIRSQVRQRKTAASGPGAKKGGSSSPDTIGQRLKKFLGR